VTDPTKIEAGIQMLPVINKMSIDQIKTLTQGVYAIREWYKGEWVGDSAKGEILVGAVPKFQLALNAMVWLTKYFAPKSVQGFKTVYRVHDAKKDKISKDGDRIKVTPFKPMLSWSATPFIVVKARESKAEDVVIGLVNPKVIFSFLTPGRLEFESLAESKNEQHKNLYRALVSLRSIARDYKSEEEVVVWHGTKPFEADIIESRSLSTLTKRTQGVLKSHGLGALGGKPDRVGSHTIGFYYKGPAAVPTVQKVTKQLGAPTKTEKKGALAGHQPYQIAIWRFGDYEISIRYRAAYRKMVKFNSWKYKSIQSKLQIYPATCSLWITFPKPKPTKK